MTALHLLYFILYSDHIHFTVSMSERGEWKQFFYERLQILLYVTCNDNKGI